MAGEAADPDSARRSWRCRSRTGTATAATSSSAPTVPLRRAGRRRQRRRPRGRPDADRPAGKILRIDPSASGGNEYGIPEDNPFADGGGAPEVWLYDVRNPWRLTFHPDSGDLWVADVGQQSWEEIDVLPASDGEGAGAGANLGWNEMEDAPLRGRLPARRRRRADLRVRPRRAARSPVA